MKKLTLLLLIGFLGITSISYFGCAKKTEPTAEEKAKVEEALSVFAESLRSEKIDSLSSFNFLKTYLEKNTFIYGSAYAIPESDSASYCTYVYLQDGKEIRKALASYKSEEWYKGPVSEKKGYWSKPYFDTEGGQVEMITYSIPVYSKDSLSTLLYVVTSDLSLQ
ncbi:MAG: cache domain-containing protein [Ignavibacteriaceae bacterium]